MSPFPFANSVSKSFCIRGSIVAVPIRNLATPSLRPAENRAIHGWWTPETGRTAETCPSEGSVRSSNKPPSNFRVQRGSRRRGLRDWTGVVIRRN